MSSSRWTIFIEYVIVIVIVEVSPSYSANFSIISVMRDRFCRQPTVTHRTTFVHMSVECQLRSSWVFGTASRRFVTLPSRMHWASDQNAPHKSCRRTHTVHCACKISKWRSWVTQRGQPITMRQQSEHKVHGGVLVVEFWSSVDEQYCLSLLCARLVLRCHVSRHA